MRTTQIALLSTLFLAGCPQDDEAVAREKLAEQGMVDINLTPIKTKRGAYRVRAKRGEDSCRGEIWVAGDDRNTVECVPPPGPMEQSLPSSSGEKPQLAAQGCDRGDQEACAALADLFATGDGVATDVGRASKMHRDLCDKGREASCKVQSVMAARAEKDSTKARPLWVKACEEGNADACTVAARWELTERGGPKDERAGRAHAAMACDGGDDFGCGWLGVAFYGGMGGPRDVDEGVMLMEKSCKAGNDPVCKILETTK